MCCDILYRFIVCIFVTAVLNFGFLLVLWLASVQESFVNMERKTIDLEQGWDYMQTGITKLKRILEGLPEPAFDSEQYMMLYT